MKQKKKTVAIANMKGGVGKTTISDEFAFWCDRKGIPSRLYDMDGQGGSAYQKEERWQPKNAYKDLLIEIIDTPGSLTEELGKVFQRADVIIIPTYCSFRDIFALRTMLDILEGSKIPIIFVFNRFNDRHKLDQQFIEWFESHYPSATYLTLPQSQAFNNAAAGKTSVAKIKASGKPVMKLNELFELVVKTLNVD